MLQRLVPALLAGSLMASMSMVAANEWQDFIDLDLNYSRSALESERDGWDLRLGLAFESEPTYQGSSSNETELDLFAVAAWRSDWGNIFLAGDGLGYSQMLTDNFGLLLQLEAEDTRESNDDDVLRGLPDQEEELELEIVGRYFAAPWHIGAAIALATGDKGQVWFVGGGYSWRLIDDRMLITLAADLSGASSDNLRTDFGITPQQSAASERNFRVFTPEAGLKSMGVQLFGDFALTEQWFLRGGIELEQLLGDVADSPLVADVGDETNVEAELGFFYRF